MISRERCLSLFLVAAVISGVTSKAQLQSSGTTVKAGFENAVNVVSASHLITSTDRPVTEPESEADDAVEDDLGVVDTEESSAGMSPDVESETDEDDVQGDENTTEDEPDEDDGQGDENTTEDETDKDNILVGDSSSESESDSSDVIEVDTTTEKPRRRRPIRPECHRPGHGRMGTLAQFILERRRAMRDREGRLGNPGRPSFNNDRLTDMAIMLSLLHGFDK